MRIAILGARGFPHTYGGFETFIGQLAPRLVRRGHEVMAYNRSSLFPERLPSYQGVQLRYLPSIETKSLGTPTHTLFAALDVIRQDVDIVFVVNVGNWLHCLILNLRWWIGQAVCCAWAGGSCFRQRSGCARGTLFNPGRCAGCGYTISGACCPWAGRRSCRPSVNRPQINTDSHRFAFIWAYL